MQITKLIDRDPFFYDKDTVTTIAVGQLDATYVLTAQAVYLTVEDNNIRYRIDGGDPDANDGHLVYAGQNIYLASPKAIRNFRMIAIGGNAVVIATFYR